ncbi:Peroxisomal membrane protein MPV17 and related proteins [Phaffia rhodozyma]|uniref:Peroxisomal membrane protein MPV17 and related proteins n=1 Tax=Phaffia rhodozyma TaxID=264483 RepID=A0A0F7SF46_PHARH|nr:Peroxisomal membrane protein MPV17 and related proteins [Phaffia rhodozyma]
MIQLLYSFARFYNDSFRRSPGTTLALTNGALTGFADAVAQTTQIKFLHTGTHETRPIYDPWRTLRFLAFGVAIGPLIGKWNVILEKNFPLRPATAKSILTPSNSGAKAAGSIDPKPKVSLAALGKRVFADQIVMAPIGLVLFIGTMGALEGKSIDEIGNKYKEMFGPAIVANWSVWPAIQLINFRYMPLAYRVPFQSSCGVLWNLYISILNSKTDKLAIAEAEKNALSLI